MKLEEVFDIVRQKRFAVVSTVHESVAPEAALVGFALTERNEIVFDGGSFAPPRQWPRQTDQPSSAAS